MVMVAPTEVSHANTTTPDPPLPELNLLPSAWFPAPPAPTATAKFVEVATVCVETAAPPPPEPSLPVER
jgi:hypothetical protein